MEDIGSLLHDAWIEAVEIGPRREVRLRLVKSIAAGGTAEEHETLILRFAAIDNFADVKAFFDGLPVPAMPRAYRDEILELRRIARGWRLELDHGGAVEIHTAKPPGIEPAAVMGAAIMGRLGTNVSVATVLLALAFLMSGSSGAQEDAGRKENVESVSIEVIGMTVFGKQYQKRAEIDRAGDGYTVKYWISKRRLPPRQDLTRGAPDCARELDPEDARVRGLLHALDALTDEGDAALCCDHPWSEIEIAYDSPTRPARKLNVGEDILRGPEMERVADCFGAP